MNILWFFVLCVAIAVALPVDRKNTKQLKVSISAKRAKRSVGLDINNYGVNIDKTSNHFDNNDFSIDSSVSAFKRWQSKNPEPDSLSGQLILSHKPTGVELSLGADHALGSDYMFKLGGRYDVYSSKNVDVSVDGQYDWYYSPDRGTDSDYLIDVNGRYRKIDWDVNNKDVNVGTSYSVFDNNDQVVQASISTTKDFNKRFWQEWVRVVTAKLSMMDRDKGIGAYVGLDHFTNRGDEISTGLTYGFSFERLLNVIMSTGYRWHVGDNESGKLSVGLRLRF